MINIRPVSDLRNKFPELEKTVMESNEPVFPDDKERKLDEADAAAAKSDERYSADEVFTRVRSHIREKV